MISVWVLCHAKGLLTHRAIAYLPLEIGEIHLRSLKATAYKYHGSYKFLVFPSSYCSEICKGICETLEGYPYICRAFMEV